MKKVKDFIGITIIGTIIISLLIIVVITVIYLFGCFVSWSSPTTFLVDWVVFRGIVGFSFLISLFLAGNNLE